MYIDLAWDARLDSLSRQITGIDMDLDVVRRSGAEGTWIDDRNEWEEHSALYEYPPDVMIRIETLALDLDGRVREHIAPFDAATADPWLDRLEALDLTAPTT